MKLGMSRYRKELKAWMTSFENSEGSEFKNNMKQIWRK